jgi:hypothetical protein
LWLACARLNTASPERVREIQPLSQPDLTTAKTQMAVPFSTHVETVPILIWRRQHPPNAALKSLTLLTSSLQRQIPPIHEPTKQVAAERVTEPTPPPSGGHVVALKRYISSLLDSLSRFRQPRIFGLVFGGRMLPWIRRLRGDLTMTSSLDCSWRAPHGLILCRPPPPMGHPASFMFVPLSSTNSCVLFRFSLIVIMGCGRELNFRFSSAIELNAPAEAGSSRG